MFIHTHTIWTAHDISIYASACYPSSHSMTEFHVLSRFDWTLPRRVFFNFMSSPKRLKFHQRLSHWKRNEFPFNQSRCGVVWGLTCIFEGCHKFLRCGTTCISGLEWISTKKKMNRKNKSIGMNYFWELKTVKLWQSNCVKICALYFQPSRRANAMKVIYSCRIVCSSSFPFHSGRKPPTNNVVVEMNVANPLVWRKSFDKKLSHLSEATLNTQHK